MKPLRDAIIRVAKSVRQLDNMRSDTTVKKPIKRSTVGPTKYIDLGDNNFTKEGLKEKIPYITNFQRKRYQDFLEPLEIPNLKVMHHDKPQFREAIARSNWQIKRSSHSRGTSMSSLLSERGSFDKMVDYLVKITPDHLKLEKSHNNNILINILTKQENAERENKFEVDRCHYKEIPPMPTPLTKESFQKYIYFLTHSKIYYRNSSSLENGLVVDILLYTHSLTNEKFKPYRSVHTYNYLIKFFGFDKNQSSFAREMILVMNKDGHKPNIETINNLLRLCKIHSNIRSTTNTYQIVLKYLKLSKTLDLEINLTTYNRIYDSINNIFLKELFLNKIASISLPISRNLILRIIDDYTKTTKDTKQLIAFIEDELKIDWKNDSKIFNKIAYHRGLTSETDQEINDAVNIVSSEITDEFTAKYVMEAINRNDTFPNKYVALLSVYARVADRYSFKNLPIIFKYLTLGILDSPLEINTKVHLIRGILWEATEKLDLPNEVMRFGDAVSQPENYRILKRIVGLEISDLETKTGSGFATVVKNGKHPEIREISFFPINSEKLHWRELLVSLSYLNSVDYAKVSQALNRFVTRVEAKGSRDVTSQLSSTTMHNHSHSRSETSGQAQSITIQTSDVKHQDNSREPHILDSKEFRQDMSEGQWETQQVKDRQRQQDHQFAVKEWYLGPTYVDDPFKGADTDSRDRRSHMRRMQANRIAHSRARDRLLRLEYGNDRYIEMQLLSRGILTDV